MPQLVLAWATVFWWVNHVSIKPLGPTQFPALSRTGNEYQPKCDDAVQLGSNGSFIPVVDKCVVTGKTV